MDTLREKQRVDGLGVIAFKQASANILCKVTLTRADAVELCKRTKSGLFKNKEFHDRFINMIVTELNKVEKESFNAK